MANDLRIADNLKLPLDWMTLATVVYGARGAGKTSFGRVVAEEVARNKQRFCAIDLKGDWYGLKSTAAGDDAGIPIVIFGGDHADLPLEEGAGKFVAETIASLDQSAVIDLEYFSKGKQTRFLTEFFEHLYHVNRDPLLLLADEAQRYAPQKPQNPDQSKCLGAVEDVVKLGRKHGIGVVVFTQRGSGLNKEVSELCDALVAFRTPGVLDQGRVKDWLEANATREERDRVMSELAGLATGTAVFASGHPDLKLFSIVNVRRPWTFDSSATPKPGQRKIEPKVLAESDIEALKEKMAEAIERAKLDDPAELRRRLAQVESQLQIALRNLDEERARPSQTEPVVEYVEVPVLDENIRQSLASQLLAVADFLEGDVPSLLESLTTELSAVYKLIDRWAPGDTQRAVEAHARGPLPPFKRPETGHANTEAETSPRAAGSASLRGTQPPASSPPEMADKSLGKGERKVMNILAQSENYTPDQVTFLAGYSASSSTMSVLLSKLRRLGYVEPGQPLRLTQAGRDMVGPVVSLPTGPELLLFWMSQPRLKEPEKKVLRALVDAYPDPLNHEELCAITGYSPSASTMSVLLSKLRRLGLVEKGARRLIPEFAEAIK